MAFEFSKDKVTWSKPMNLDLAKFMESKPNMWDPKHPKFSHVGMRDEAYAEFASRYDDLSWIAVKHRWTNIRSTYGFYMRKLNANKNNGRDFKVGWFMWKPCKYLFKVHRYKPVKSAEENATEDHEISNDGMASDTSDDGQDNVTCRGIVNDIATVFKGVQKDKFDVDRSKYAAVGDSVTTMLSQLNSYEAAQMAQKILEILAEYDEKNPMNPNGLRH